MNLKGPAYLQAAMMECCIKILTVCIVCIGSSSLAGGSQTPVIDGVLG